MTNASKPGDAYRRCLDLLAGWASFAHRASEAGEHDAVSREQYEREADAVSDLYQRLGALDGDYEALDREAVTLVTTAILSLIVHGRVEVPR